MAFSPTHDPTSKRQRRPAFVGPLAVVALSLALSLSACASPAGVNITATRHAFLGAGEPPALHPRCRAYDVAVVPARFAAFEAEIAAWIATCVTSRTDSAHRELALVVGNDSVWALWRAAATGQRLRVVAGYQWSPGATADDGRVERIAFWSPDIPGTEPAGERLARDGAAASEPGAAPPDGARRPGLPPRPPDSRETRDPPWLPDVHETREPPDDLRDIMDDARRMLDWLRRAGAGDDARRLAALLERARPIVTDVVLLVGGYYFASRLLAGRLVFQWGWRAAGSVFARRLARLDRLLPGAERALGELSDEMVRVAGHHPQLGGTGINWKVIDQVFDPSVPAQLDDLACGPACLQIVLEDRGVFVSQAQLIETARTVVPELKTRMVTSGTLAGILKELDAAGGWTRPTGVLLDQPVGPLSALLSRRGSWIAKVGQHFVVVDGIDSAGNVVIRDPWPAPGARHGVSGSRYRVSLETFASEWLADGSIYRK